MATITAAIVLEASAFAAHVFKFAHPILRKLYIPVYGLNRWVPLFGGKSAPELATLGLLFVIFLIAAFNSKGKDVGRIADVVGAIVMLFGMRKTSIRKVLRTDAAIFWHKCLAEITSMLLLIHCIQMGVSSTGIVMAILLLSLPIVYSLHRFGQSLFPVKYMWFYWHHVVSIFIFIPIAFVHGAMGISLMGIVWYLDLLNRYIISSRSGDLQVVRVSESVAYVEVTLSSKKPLQVGPAQYLYLNIPIISSLDFHPFSAILLQKSLFSMSGRKANEDTQRVCFYVRREGDWTSQLYGLGVDSAVRGGDDTLGATNFPVKVEGAYGSVSVDFANAEVYAAVILVAGGVGITPMISILSHYINTQQTTTNKNQRRQKVILIWSVRDAEFAQDLYRRVLAPLLTQQFATEMTTNNILHAHNLSYMTDEEEDDLYRDNILNDISHNNNNNNNNNEEKKKDPNDLEVAMSQLGIDLELKLFYTGGPVTTGYQASIASQSLQRNAQWVPRRPCMSELLSVAITNINTSRKNTNENQYNETPRAAVLICGPEAMVEEVRDLCDQQLYLAKDSGVRIPVDCHEESFIR